MELRALWHHPSLQAAQSIEGAVWHRATIVLPLLMPSTLTPLPPSGDTGVTKAVSSSGKLVGDNPVIQFPAEGATQKEGEVERKEA